MQPQTASSTKQSDRHRAALGPGSAAESLLQVLVRAGGGALGDEAILTALVTELPPLFSAALAWVCLEEEPGTPPVVAAAGGAWNEPPVGRTVEPMPASRTTTAVCTPPAALPQPGTAAIAQEQGLETVAWAELLRDDRCLGWVYLGWTEPTDPGPDRLRLLGSIATCAAGALYDTRRAREVATRRERLQDWLSVHEQMSLALIRDGGVKEILEMARRLLDREVVFGALPPAQEILPAAVWTDSGVRGLAVASSRQMIAVASSWQVIAGAEPLGWLVALGEEPLTPKQVGILRYAARLMALEVVKLWGASESMSRLRSELLDELIGGADPQSEMIQARARRLELRLDAVLVVYAFAGDAGAGAGHGILLQAAQHAASVVARGGAGQPMITACGDCVVVVLPFDCEHRESIVARIQERAGRMGLSVSAGISVPRAGAIAASTAEARRCLGLALRAPRPELVVDAATIGPLSFLLDVVDLNHVAAVSASFLRPIREHDRRARVPFLPTLTAWVEADGCNAVAARQCGIHQSTLKYRIARTQEILGVSLAQRQNRLRLAMAVRIDTLLNSLGMNIDAPLT